jgi:hypothetical protein
MIVLLERSQLSVTPTRLVPRLTLASNATVRLAGVAMERLVSMTTCAETEPLSVPPTPFVPTVLVLTPVLVSQDLLETERLVPPKTTATILLVLSVLVLPTLLVPLSTRVSSVFATVVTLALEPCVAILMSAPK